MALTVDIFLIIYSKQDMANSGTDEENEKYGMRVKVTVPLNFRFF